MKRNCFFAYTVAVAMLVLSCSKESDNIQQKGMAKALTPELKTLYHQLPDVTFPSITTLPGNILRFSNPDEYESTIQLLIELCEKWDDLFYEKYGSMEPDDLCDLEDKLQYNQYQPLIEFELAHKTYGSTLRGVQAGLLEKWLCAKELNFDNKPRDPIIIDPIEQTLYNIHKEVCIGDTIYHHKDDGHIIAVYVKEIEKLNYVRETSGEKLLASGNFTGTAPEPKGSSLCTTHRGVPYNTFGDKYISSTLYYDWTYNFSRRNNNKYISKALMENYEYKAKKRKWKPSKQKVSVGTYLYLHSDIKENNVTLHNAGGLSHTDGFSKVKNKKSIKDKSKWRAYANETFFIGKGSYIKCSFQGKEYVHIVY